MTISIRLAMTAALFGAALARFVQAVHNQPDWRKVMSRKQICSALSILLLMFSLEPFVEAQPQRGLASIASDSFLHPIPTVAIGGTALAISPSDLNSTVDLQVPAYVAHGISRGWLAFSALEEGFPDPRLRVIDILTGERRLLIPDWKVLSAAWRPGDSTLAVIAYQDPEYALLLINAGTGEVTARIDRPIDPVLLRWSEDGSLLYTVHEIHPSTQRSPDETLYSLARYSVTGSPLGESRVDPDVLPLLASLDDAALEQVARGPGTFPWNRVPKTIDARGGLGVAPGGQFTRAVVLGRQGDVLLIKDLAQPNGDFLKVVNLSSGAVSVLLTTKPEFRLPWPQGLSRQLTQTGYEYAKLVTGTYDTNVGTGHTGKEGYAYDFGISGADHVLASAPGTVFSTVRNIDCNALQTTCTGVESPYSASCTGTAANGGWGNVVILQLADGNFIRHAHLKYNSVKVQSGDRVVMGQYLGDPGHTGNTRSSNPLSCGDHLHFQYEDASGYSLPTGFLEKPIPLVEKAQYISQNPEALPAAPTAPSGLSAKALSSSSIAFSWVDNSNNETTFLVRRWNGTVWVQIATVGTNVTSYTDTGLQPATTYYHTVCAQNSAGTTCASSYSTATTTQGSMPPTAPSGLSAKALSSSSIAFSWVDNSNNETSFLVYRWNGSAWVQITTVGTNVTSYTDTGLQPATTYYHTVCAQNSAGTTCASSYSTATTTQGSTPPTAPSGLSAKALSSSSIAFSWVDNSNNETSFLVYRWNGSAWVQITTVGTNVTSYTDTGLQPATTYYHTVCAQNSAGTTCASSYSTATTTQGSTPPTAPSGLSAKALSSSSIAFSWVDNSNNETSFLVYRWNGSAWLQIATVGTNVTSYTNTGLLHATTYYYTVCAQNSTGTTCATSYSTGTTL